MKYTAHRGAWLQRLAGIAHRLSPGRKPHDTSRHGDARDRDGAGLFIVNPSYAFKQSLPPLLEALRAALAPERHMGEIAAYWLDD